MNTKIKAFFLTLCSIFVFSSFKAQSQSYILMEGIQNSSLIQTGSGNDRKIGLGIPNPYAKLHIQAQNIFPASQIDMMDSYMGNPFTYGSIKIWHNVESTYYGIFQDSLHDGRTMKNFFQNNVGIGVLNPVNKLDVDGIISSKGLKLNGRIYCLGDSATGIDIGNNGVPFVIQYSTNGSIPDTGSNEEGSGSYTYPLKIYSYGIEASYLRCTSTTSTNNLQIKSNSHAGSILMSYDLNGNSVWTPPAIFKIYNTGQVSIGADTIFPDYKLAVNGKVRCKEMKVTLNDWPDYVFNKEYHLYSLQEVDQFIRKNKHLPDMPSAAEVHEQGVDVGEMNARLVKKVEELTLYLIAMQKEIEELKAKVGSR